MATSLRHLCSGTDGRSDARVPGKKIGAREVKLAMIALLIHPSLILLSAGLFAATNR